MLFSPVVGRGMQGGSIGFLAKTPNLFNVAITRARSCLIVVGSKAAAANSDVSHLAAFARYTESLKKPTQAIAQTKVDLGENYPQVSNAHQVSEWERVLYSLMYAEGLRPIPQYAVENYILDFAIIQGTRRLNIEVDGEHYHRNWDGDLLLRDRIRNQRMIELGWDVKRFWVYQIRDEPAACIKKIKAWCKAKEDTSCHG